MADFPQFLCDRFARSAAPALPRDGALLHYESGINNIWPLTGSSVRPFA